MLERANMKGGLSKGKLSESMCPSGACSIDTRGVESWRSLSKTGEKWREAPTQA